MPVMARVTRPGSGAGPRPSTAERYPGASHAAQPSPPTIEPRLKKAEAAAGTPKMWRVLRIPIATAASATRRRKGNMMRVSVTVSSTLPGISAKPGAMAVTSAGASQMPASVVVPTAPASPPPPAPPGAGPGRPPAAESLPRRRPRAGPRRGDRQRAGEGAPGPGPALALDPPAMSGHHRVAHREPEPRPAAYVLG